MVIIVPIILILVLAFIAFCNGDSSGFEMIGKGILYIALFLGVGWIIVEIPWLIILVVVVILIWAVTSSNNTNNTTTSMDIIYNNQNKSYENKSETKSIENLTSFQSQLQQNTKTPQQVENEQQSKEIEQAKQSANVDYETIKRELLQQAESGNYTIVNGRKNITFDYRYRWKPSFIGERNGHTYINKTMFNPSGEYASEIKIFITNKVYYDAYISEIKSLLSKDGVSVQSVLLHKNTDMIYYLPHHSVGFGESTCNYEFVLRCSVQY